MELNQLAWQIDPFLAGAALQVDSTGPAIASPDAIRIFGFRFHPMTGEEVTVQIAAAVQEQRRLVMAHLNVHGLAQLYESPAMTALLKLPETLIMIDSMPILFAANLLGHRLSRSKRTTSLDFYDWMFGIGARLGWRFCYVGAEPGTLEKGIAALRDRFAGLDIEGRHGYFDMEDVSEGSRQDEILAWLRARSPDILIVGMGMPRQEEWIYRVRDEIDARVILTAGAYIDYQVGTQWLPPRWLGQVGMEWAYRLARAPRRLCRRYLVEPLVLLWRLVRRPHPMSARLRRTDGMIASEDGKRLE
jgi:N-acetylglucosaminyldiphosphoundecaprenol N-acetyl-beta-D-mannosaminyltransferase